MVWLARVTAMSRKPGFAARRTLRPVSTVSSRTSVALPRSSAHTATIQPWAAGWSGSLTLAAGWLMASPSLQPVEKQHRKPGERIYASILRLAKQTANELSDFDLRERIDIQSFI